MFSDVSIFSYVSLRPCRIDRTLSLRGPGFEGDGFSSAWICQGWEHWRCQQ